jgi:Predicted ATPase (AAA+ superfamily)
MIARDFYLNQIKDNMWDGQIKVLTGLRRSGKSVLLFELFYDYLLSTGVKKENIITISLDQRKYYKYRNPIVLCDYVESIISDRNDRYYLFIDEIQMCIKTVDVENAGIEVTVYDMLNELKSYKNLDVYVTGSNSKMLASDILTEFRGRSTQIHVYPFSFEEYYSFKGGDETKCLNEYMLYGGMPRITELSDDNAKKKYLLSLYDEVYIKDIKERNGIEREDILEEVLDYLSSQISSLTNPTKVANAIANEKKEKIDNTLISNYINHSINAFLILVAKRYDIKGKSYFKFPNKYYFTDVGLRNARLNFRQFDPGHLMENIIYIELIRRGYSVDVGVVYDRKNNTTAVKEVDFVVNDGDKRIYVQSALRMDEEDKVNAELNSLKLTNDFFKKIVIRNDIYHNYYDNNGIFHCSLIDFLLNRVELF